ncbi:hypothetical protein [Nostoc sp.]
MVTEYRAVTINSINILLQLLTRVLCNEATEELLKIEGFKEAFAKAKKNIEEGKIISVDQVQRKY